MGYKRFLNASLEAQQLECIQTLTMLAFFRSKSSLCELDFNVNIVGLVCYLPMLSLC